MATGSGTIGAVDANAGSREAGFDDLLQRGHAEINRIDLSGVAALVAERRRQAGLPDAESALASLDRQIGWCRRQAEADFRRAVRSLVEPLVGQVVAALLAEVGLGA